MRLILRASAVAALLLGSAMLAPSTAFAAPVLSGAYIFSVSSNCQAIVSTVTNAQGQVTAVNITRGGALNGVAGTATFTPDTSLAAGTAALSGVNVDGQLLLKHGVNTAALKQTNLLENWAYSNTSNAVTLNGIVYRAVYGKLVSGIAQHFNVVGREEGNRCVFAGSFTRK